MNDRRKSKFAASIIALFLLAVLLGSVALPAGARSATTSYVAVSAGRWFTCALTTSGGVKCWGDNSAGQLGDGTNTNRNSPVDVVGLTNGVTAITTSWYHACALTTQGGVKCWGANWHGQLGDGTTNDHPTPVDVTGLTGSVRAISAGWGHTCVLTDNRAMKCWGNNDDGELGDGTTMQRTTPVDVIGMSWEVDYIEAGGWHTCAMKHGLKCWGANGAGQLGDGTTIDRITPWNVSGLASGVGGITAGGWHTCATTIMGTNMGVKCWGLNNTGQLGVGTTAYYLSSPTDVVGLPYGADVIAAGEYHTCAVTPSGGALCWGWGGMLGNGDTADSRVPVNVVGLGSGVSSITAGGNHSCALMNYGGIKCWGENYYGQLGDGTNIDHLTPVDVLGSSLLDPFSIFLPLLIR